MTPPAPGSRAGSDVLANLALWFIAAVFASCIAAAFWSPS